MNTIEFLQITSAVVPDREALVEVGGTNSKRITSISASNAAWP